MTTETQEQHTKAELPCGCAIWRPLAIPARICKQHPSTATARISRGEVWATLEGIELQDPFAIRFRKRKGNAIREMLARREPPKEDAKPSYNAKSHGLMTVWDMEAGGYRSVSVETVEWFYVHKMEFTVLKGDQADGLRTAVKKEAEGR